MRSHLTRNVIRRIILNRALVPQRQLHCTGRSRPRHFQNALPLLTPPARRTLFGLFEQKNQRDLRDPLLDPGMDKMLELDKRIHLIARLPPAEHLARAFNAFIASKRKAKRPVQDFHVAQLLQTFRTIEDYEKEEGKGPYFTETELYHALETLASISSGSHTRIHVELAQHVYDNLSRLTEHNGTPQLDAETELSRLSKLVYVLASTGESEQARDLVEEYARRRKSEGVELRTRPWSKILLGFAGEENEQELLRTVDLMKELSVPIQPSVRLRVALFFAAKDDVRRTKEWMDSRAFDEQYTRTSSAFNDQISDAYRLLLEFCLRNNEMAWGQSVLQEGRALKNQDINTWSAIFQASAASGKGVNDIDRMIEVMMRRKEADKKPDISVFNGLIQHAVSRKDPYMAERYISLASKWGVSLNTQTYILQIQYRLEAGDHDGAMSAYNALRDQPITAHEDWPIMNTLVQHLTRNPKVDRSEIMSLVADLSDRRIVFPASTVKALCSFHLHRDEYFELVDLLQTFAFQYSIRDRQQLLDLLSSTALDPSSETARAWDTYMVFHQVFDLESKRDLRTAFMSEMHRRGRPDLATHVFTRMARHPRADTRPNASTYIAAFEGIAANADAEALEVVHNILKLDTDTEPDTRLLTALMLAYNAADASWHSLEIWDHIATSAEGPSFASVHAALRACERAPNGNRAANVIWERLQAADVEIGRDLFASYIGALAGNRQFEEAGEVFATMEEATRGVLKEPDEFILGTFFVAAGGGEYQEKIREWAVENFPETWARVEQRGFDEDELGALRVKGLDRSLKSV